MEHLLAFLTLSAMEIVLGIDNIVFIAILTSKYPPKLQATARRLGLFAAMGMRVMLLMVISALASLTFPLFHLFDHAFSGRDLILLAGGLFLIAKATYEIHHKLEDHQSQSAGTVQGNRVVPPPPMGFIIGQILLLDIVFSLDSVITAIGMSQNLTVMSAAIVAAVLVMMAFAGVVTTFIEHHPTVKMLALSFLLLIGVMLTFEGFGGHMNKGYIYFAMGFSLFVEMLNLRLRKAGQRIVHRIETMEPASAGANGSEPPSTPSSTLGA